MVFGTAFDGACLQFEDRCGDSGTCLLYDNQQMALYLFIVCVTVKAASLIMIIVAWKAYKPPKKVKKALEKENQDRVMNPSVHVGKEDHMANGYSAHYNGDVSNSKDSLGVISPVFVNDDGDTVQRGDEITYF